MESNNPKRSAKGFRSPADNKKTRSSSGSDFNVFGGNPVERHIRNKKSLLETLRALVNNPDSVHFEDPVFVEEMLKLIHARTCEVLKSCKNTQDPLEPSESNIANYSWDDSFNSTSEDGLQNLLPQLPDIHYYLLQNGILNNSIDSGTPLQMFLPQYPPVFGPPKEQEEAEVDDPQEAFEPLEELDEDVDLVKKECELVNQCLESANFLAIGQDKRLRRRLALLPVMDLTNYTIDYVKLAEHVKMMVGNTSEQIKEFMTNVLFGFQRISYDNVMADPVAMSQKPLGRMIFARMLRFMRWDPVKIRESLGTMEGRRMKFCKEEKRVYDEEWRKNSDPSPAERRQMALKHDVGLDRVRRAYTAKKMNETNRKKQMKEIAASKLFC